MGFFSKLTKFYVVNVCFMDDCVGEGWGGGEGVGRSGVGRCFVLVFARGCVDATLLSTISCNFWNCYLFTYETWEFLRTRLNERSTSNQNLLVFDDRGENRSAQWKTSRSKGEPRTSQPKYGENPGAIIDGRGVRISRLLQPCSPNLLKYVIWKEITR